MPESFQILRGSSMRLSSRRVCSSGLTSSQYLMSMDARVDDRPLDGGDHLQEAGRSAPGCRSPSPARRRRGCTSCGRRSRPRRPRGSARCSAARTSATSRARSGRAGRRRGTIRGLTRSVIRLIVPPLPAVSRPSNTMMIFAPVALTHSCIATSSPWSTRISASYSLRFILGFGPLAPAGPADSGVTVSSADFFDFFRSFAFLPISQALSRQSARSRPKHQRSSRFRAAWTAVLPRPASHGIIHFERFFCGPRSGRARPWRRDHRHSRIAAPLADVLDTGTHRSSDTVSSSTSEPPTASSVLAVVAAITRTFPWITPQSRCRTVRHGRRSREAGGWTRQGSAYAGTVAAAGDRTDALAPVTSPAATERLLGVIASMPHRGDEVKAVVNGLFGDTLAEQGYAPRDRDERPHPHGPRGPTRS